jgi:hypothetical protein
MAVDDQDVSGFEITGANLAGVFLTPTNANQQQSNSGSRGKRMLMLP